MTTTLSAREQERVSRITGQPLITMAQNKPTASAGLVGAIGVREMEKEQLKQGINSRAVQQAIAQRQQQQQFAYPQQQYSEQMAAEYRPPPSQYGNMGQYPTQFSGHTARQQSWVSPAAQVFAQGGGFTAPTPPVFTTPPEQGGSPSQQYPQRQQYFQPQQPGGGQGRGSPGFHGHGY
jgi:CCR4-NOT transcriptional complex subunit CAF120